MSLLRIYSSSYLSAYRSFLQTLQVQLSDSTHTGASYPHSTQLERLTCCSSFFLGNLAIAQSQHTLKASLVELQVGQIEFICSLPPYVHHGPHTTSFEFPRCHQRSSIPFPKSSHTFDILPSLFILSFTFNQHPYLSFFQFKLFV